MKIEREELDRIAALCARANRAAMGADLRLHRGDVETARRRVEEAGDGAWLALQGLLRAGAQMPEGVPEPDEVPLPLLDTPANRRYAALLRDLLDAAREIDRERRAGGMAHSGKAEQVLELLLIAELEVFGPPER